MACYAGEGYFFLENGLYFPELERRLGFKVTDKPTAFACSLGLRERVDPPDRGATWEFHSGTDLDELGRRLVYCWETDGLAFIDTRIEPGDLLSIPYMAQVIPLLEYCRELYGHDFVQAAVDADFKAFLDSPTLKFRPRRQERLEKAAELDSIGLRPSLRAEDWERLATPYLFDPLGPLLNEIDKSIQPLSDSRLGVLHQIGRGLLKTLDPEIPDQREALFRLRRFLQSNELPESPENFHKPGT